jgi:hypothetical protein
VGVKTKRLQRSLETNKSVRGREYASDIAIDKPDGMAPHLGLALAVLEEYSGNS